MKTARITSALHTRGFALAVVLVALLCAIVFHAGQAVAPITGDKGLGLPSANLWLGQGTLNFVCAVAGSATTAVLMMLLNKIYNVFRAITYIFVPFFLAMQLATPELSTQLYTGTVLSVVIPLCMLLMFNCYRSPASTRQVFLIMLLLSLFTATQYCYAIYIPAMLIGFAQMRIFNRRTLVAALMGILTPWIMLLGFGVVTVDELHFPHLTSIFSVIDFGDTLMLLLAVGFTVLAMLVCFTLNVLRTIAYNARARAVNGMFTVIILFTLVAMCADFINMVSYIPLLNFCAAMEITHYFSTHRAEKSFIAIISVLAVYAALFACQTII